MEIEKSKAVRVVYTNTDCTEGRGYDFPLFVCESEAAAMRLAKRRYVQGSDAPVKECVAVMVNGSWLAPVRIETSTADDERKQVAINARREALKKAKDAGLSDDDLAWLGGAK